MFGDPDLKSYIEGKNTTLLVLVFVDPAALVKTSLVMANRALKTG